MKRKGRRGPDLMPWVFLLILIVATIMMGFVMIRPVWDITAGA